MSKVYRFDPKCLDLANHFTGHADGCECHVCTGLAQDLQDAAEAYEPSEMPEVTR